MTIKSFEVQGEIQTTTISSPTISNPTGIAMTTDRGTLLIGNQPEIGGPTHFHIMKDNNSGVDLFFGDDYNYVLQRGSYGLNSSYGVEIGANDMDGGDQQLWHFGTDGSTTFPTLTVPISDNANPSGTGQTIKFSDSTQQAIIYGPASTEEITNADRIIIQGAPGYPGTDGEGGDVYLWAGPGGDTGGSGGDIKIRAGQGQLTGSGGYLNFQAGQTDTGYGGYINVESGASNTFGQGGPITLQARSGGDITLRTFNSEGNSRELVLDNAGATTFPGAVVNSTVAKTGSVQPGTGEVATVTLLPTNNPALTPGVYAGIFLGIGLGFTATYTVAENGDITATVTSSNGGFQVGDNGILNGSVIGGTSPADDVTVTVATLTNVVGVTALDLTKSVNKLTDGYYSLAAGVEGQIMYLVRQTGSVYNAITVVVANARIDGVIYTDIEHYPFNIGPSAADMDTLIFTDNAWQAIGGSWD